jgi:hypothetical protein
MSTTIAALTPSVVKLLGNRGDVAALTPEAMGNVVEELSNNYPFEELRITGPLVQFTSGINQYNPSFFQATPSGGNPFTLNKVVSWFFYLQPPTNLTTVSSTGYANPGYNLKFRDVEDLEVLANTLSLPQFWSWLGSFLYVAATPNQAYYTYVRYQWLHPFTGPIALSTDPIYMPATWYDIIEYATAERIALNLRMEDVATRYHNVLFGDPEFQRSSGGRGQPGLIARRTSQTQKNQSRSTRAMRVVRSSY